MTIRKLFTGSGYLIHESETDTTNIVCQFGQIYADGEWLFAAIYNGTTSQIRALRKLGESIMDGDGGELTIRFPPARFRDVVRIMRPRQEAIRRGTKVA